IIKELKEQYPNLEGIVGGALGVDTDAARACYLNDVPFHIYAPCYDQDSRWPADSQQGYKNMREAAASVRYIKEGPYSGPQVMQDRNEAMVDDCDILVAVHRPEKEYGGTWNCIQYAKSRNTNIIYINPNILI
ncbi:MAG: SLOG family protein, partial [Actinobacteria bacterium]|nr:SLOG family protein [Actinomycetota bacterium]